MISETKKLNFITFQFFLQIWSKSTAEAKGDFEQNLDCCGWATLPVTVVNGTVAHCSAACVTQGANGTQTFDNCHTCKETVEDKIDYAFNSSGGVGLFFAFTEVIFFFQTKIESQSQTVRKGLVFSE